MCTGTAGWKGGEFVSWVQHCVSCVSFCRLGTEHNRIISSILQAEEEGSGQPQSERSRPGMHKQSALGKRGRNSSEGAKGQLPVIADMMGGVGACPADCT